MHLADGVLSMPAVIGTSIAAGGLLINSVRKVENEDIPKISLMTATFFTFSLISFPIGPSSVHPLVGGLLGIMLGYKSTIAIFIGLLLQAIIFRHGGITTLGINTILISIPAIISYLVFSKIIAKNKNIFKSGIIVGFLSVLLTLLILIIVLVISNPIYGDGFLSVINILIISHLPLAIGEGLLTGLILNFIYSSRPNILSHYKI